MPFITDCSCEEEYDARCQAEAEAEAEYEAQCAEQENIENAINYLKSIKFTPEMYEQAYNNKSKEE